MFDDVLSRIASWKEERCVRKKKKCFVEECLAFDLVVVSGGLHAIREGEEVK